MFYAARGSIPPKRHTQHRAPDGSLYAEELFGVEGFTGRSSILYHLVPPTQTYRIEPVGRVELVAADDGLHRHRLTKTGDVPPKGDAISGRIPLYFNNDVVFGVVRPAEPMPPGSFYRNGIADEMLYVHEGTGLCDTVFGPLRYGPGDYLVLPIGTSGAVGGIAGGDLRVEAMEGFGVLRACELAGVPAVEIRAISNELAEGDRSRWRIGRALEALADVVPGVLEAAAK